MELKMLASVPRKWNNYNLNLLLVFHVEHIVLLPLQNHVRRMVARQLGDFGSGDRTRSASQEKPSSQPLPCLFEVTICLPMLFCAGIQLPTILLGCLFSFYGTNVLLRMNFCGDICFSCKLYHFCVVLVGLSHLSSRIYLTLADLPFPEFSI